MTLLQWKIVNAFKKVDNIYIADGHHRAASSSFILKVINTRNPVNIYPLVDTQNVHH